MPWGQGRGSEALGWHAPACVSYGEKKAAGGVWDGGQVAEGRQFHSLGEGLRCDVAMTGVYASDLKKNLQSNSIAHNSHQLHTWWLCFAGVRRATQEVAGVRGCLVAFNSLLPACCPIETLRQAPRESVLTLSVHEGWSNSLQVTQPEGRPGIGTPGGRL